MEIYNLTKDAHKFYEQTYKEHRKTEKEVKEYVDILLKWIEEQPHFPENPVKSMVKIAIVSCKFSVERAKEKIDMYYTLRRHMPEIFCTHPLSPEMRKLHDTVICVPLPKLTENHHRLIYWKLHSDSTPEEFRLNLVVANITHIIEIMINEDTYYNVDIIIDCEGIKIDHMVKYTPMMVKKMGIILEKIYANRISKIFVFNLNSFAENILNIMKRFLTKKINERINVCDSSDIVLKHYGKLMLPKDIGGEEKSLKELQGLWFKKYEEYNERFTKIQYMTTDESKRPTKLVNDDLLGFYGSFKQISID